MSKIIIDNQEFDYEALPLEFQQRIQMLQFVESELVRLEGLTAAMQTAKIAYKNALRTELPKLAAAQAPALPLGDTISLG